MGGGASKQEAPQNATIDLQLLDNQLDELFKFKILLLGAGESGKSTVVKQLKLLHHTALSPKELRQVATSLHQNVLDCSRSLVAAARNFGFDLEFDQMKTENLLLTHDDEQPISPELGERILRLFHSPAMQKAFERRNEFWLLDSYTYCLKHLPRFTEPGFVPSAEDAVMARVRTTGIVNTELVHTLGVSEPKAEGEPDALKFQVVDVGGQRNERKKWMHCFDDVRAILFVVNLAGFNQVLFEDSAKNRLHEELELFEQISSNALFADVPLLLFLNKKDLFEQMISGGADLRKAFPHYAGARGDTPAALRYVMETFRRKLPAGKAMAIHPVSARCQEDIQRAFEDVRRQLYDEEKQTLIAQANHLRAQKRRAERGADKEAAGCGCG